MGQQQLLLIILGVIIVGIAVAVGITMFQDNAVDQNRSAVISDLTTLAAKGQQYYAKPTTLGGGGNSFVGLTADATGLGLLASTAFTNNANGTYTVKTAGTATTLVLHGVGKTALSDGTFPTYDMTVTSQTQVPTKIN
jgi:Tfp pilus assembly protein PilE